MIIALRSFSRKAMRSNEEDGCLGLAPARGDFARLINAFLQEIEIERAQALSLMSLASYLTICLLLHFSLSSFGSQ